MCVAAIFSRTGREHLTRVLAATFKATETEELERTRAQLAEQRKRYDVGV